MDFRVSTYYTPEIHLFVANLVHTYSYDSFDDLSDDDKYQFASLLLNSIKGNADHEFFGEGQEFPHTIESLKRLLTTGLHEDEEAFVFQLKKHILKYYDKSMRSLFEYIHTDFQSEKNQWLDQACHRGDPDYAFDQYRNSYSL